MTMADKGFLEKKNPRKTFLFSHVEQTTSTNSDLLNWVKNESVDAVVVLSADRQTAGRGTRGRLWKNPKNALMFSVAVALSNPIQRYVGVTLTIGVKLVEFLRSKGLDAALKWPNDIVVNHRKLAGILVENTKSKDGVNALIVGVGLNLEQADFELDEYQACAVSDFLTQRWTPCLKEQWRESMVGNIVEAIDEIQEFGLAKTVTEWKNVAAYQDEMIDLYQDGEIVCTALVQGIDESGRLLVSTSTGMRAFMSGMISLRKK